MKGKRADTFGLRFLSETRHLYRKPHIINYLQSEGHEMDEPSGCSSIGASVVRRFFAVGA